MNSFGLLFYLSKSLELDKEVLPQEALYMTFVAKLNRALSKVLDLVKTCVLQFQRKASLNSASLDVAYKYACFSNLDMSRI
jgi:hypothetical protein